MIVDSITHVELHMSIKAHLNFEEKSSKLILKSGCITHANVKQIGYY